LLAAESLACEARVCGKSLRLMVSNSIFRKQTERLAPSLKRDLGASIEKNRPNGVAFNPSCSDESVRLSIIRAKWQFKKLFSGELQCV
jgi:hypothetical protein